MTNTGKSRIKQINMLIFLETNMFQFQRKEVQIYNQEVRKNPVTVNLDHCEFMLGFFFILFVLKMNFLYFP